MIDELNEAKDNKNKILDELIVLLIKNVASCAVIVVVI